jgi:hypothetical protein
LSDKKGQRPSDDLLDWFTVSYRSIFLVVAAVLVLGALGGYAFYTRHAPSPEPTEAPTPSGGSTARFRTLEGSVKVKPVGTFEWVPADTSTVLRKSDLVRTGPGSAAEISFFDGTIVHVRPDSLITIEETAEDPSTKQRKVAWHISSGEVNFQTVRRTAAGGAAEISTPTVRTTAAEQTEGGIRVAQSGDSDVRIWKGSGQVETRTGERVSLGPSEAVAVDANGKAAPKKVLPPVPTLLAPPHQAEITYPDPSRATTMLAWKAVPGATSYHVMLDYSAYFNRPIVDRGGIGDSSVQLQGLDTGKYYWRVAAVDKEGVEGAYSEFARFTVVRRGGPGNTGGPPPPLAIQELELRTNILQIKGRTEAGATVTVNGQRVDVQSDGSFNEFITLDKPGRQMVVVRATGLAGGVNEQRRQVVVAD